ALVQEAIRPGPDRELGRARVEGEITDRIPVVIERRDPLLALVVQRDAIGEPVIVGDPAPCPPQWPEAARDREQAASAHRVRHDARPREARRRELTVRYERERQAASVSRRPRAPAALLAIDGGRGRILGELRAHRLDPGEERQEVLAE